MRRSDIWLAGGLAAMTVVALSAGVVPRLGHTVWLRGELARLDSELAKPTGGPEVLSRLEDDLAALRRFGEGRMTPIPRDADIAGLMASVSETLGRHGIERRDIVTRDARRVEGAAALPLSITLQAPFASVDSALREIEELPRLIRIERLRLARAGSGGGSKAPVDRSGVVRAEIVLSAFFDPEGSVSQSRGGGK